MDRSFSGELEKLVKVIKESKRFVVATHVRPDGDGLGSLLALGLLLREMGKQTFISWGESIVIPPQYDFLPGLDLIQDPAKCPNFENWIIVDCASGNRLGVLEEKIKEASLLINIDHHQDNKLFGHINLVDKNISASAEIIFLLSKALNHPLNKEIATCLYVGILTDTGRFQYSNTSPQTFQIASELLAYELQPYEIFQKVYENINFSTVKLLSIALTKAVFDSQLKLVYTCINQDDVKRSGSQMEETENFIDFLRAVKGAEVAVIFKEVPNGTTRVSLRSKGRADVAKIASMFGGGGHRNAAGYTSADSYEASLQKFLEELKKLVQP